MSEASRARAPSAPECPNDHEATAMRPAVLRVHFPAATLPVEGFKCPVCGEETIAADVVARSQKLARQLGLFGPEHPTPRKLVKNGSSLAVTLDKESLREILGHDPASGETVMVGRRGSSIVIERAHVDSVGGNERGRKGQGPGDSRRPPRGQP